WHLKSLRESGRRERIRASGCSCRNSLDHFKRSHLRSWRKSHADHRDGLGFVGNLLKYRLWHRNEPFRQSRRLLVLGSGDRPLLGTVIAGLGGPGGIDLFAGCTVRNFPLQTKNRHRGGGGGNGDQLRLGGHGTPRGTAGASETSRRVSAGILVEPAGL